MNNTINELIKRKSVRVFTDKEISKEDKESILLASVNAPSAGNMQLYTIIDVTDQKLKEELVKTCDNQPFIAEAKMVLIYCADYNKWYEGFKETGCEPRKPQAGDLMLAVTDAAIAAQNAVTAAESLGIGSCYIGDIMENYEKQKALLGLPRYVFPCVMIVFGYPTIEQLEREKPKRADLSLIVSENSYPNMDFEYRKALFEYKKGGKTYEEYMKKFCDFKCNSDFSIEMSNSVKKYLKEFE